ncbi:MAG: hypothetical protein ACXAC7_11635, partial [Candidatus Hodarchaeales archaeon]
MSTLISELSESEEKAYHDLIAFGQLSLGEICAFNDFQIDEGHKIINNLIEKGLASQIEGLTNRYIPRFPFFESSKELEESLTKVKMIKENISTYFDEKSQEIKSLQEIKQNEINESLNSNISQLNESKSNFENQIQQSMIEFKNELTKTENDNKISELSGNFVQQVEIDHQGIKTQTGENTSQVQKQSSDEIQSFKDSLNSYSSNFLDVIQSTVLNDIQKAIGEIKQIIDGLNTDIENYESSIDKQAKEWMEKANNNILTNNETLKTSFNAFIDKSNHSIQTEKDGLDLLDLTSTPEELSTNGAPLISKPLTEIREYLLGLQEELKQLKNTFDAELENHFKEGNDIVQQSVDNSSSQITNIISQFNDKRASQDSEFQQKISNLVETNKTESSELIMSTTTKSDLVEQQNSEKINTLKNNVQAQHDHAQEEIQKFIQNLETKIQEDFKLQLINWKEGFKNSLDEINNLTGTHFDSL